MIELNPSNGGIISMDIYNDIILIGTISAEIHEIPLLSKKQHYYNKDISVENYGDWLALLLKIILQHAEVII